MSTTENKRDVEKIRPDNAARDRIGDIDVITKQSISNKVDSMPLALVAGSAVLGVLGMGLYNMVQGREMQSEKFMV
jgi:hypothetical protein